MRFITTFAILVPATMADDLTASEEENNRVQKYIVWTWLAIVLTLLVYRFTIASLQHVRMLVNMGINSNTDGRQRYFSIPNNAWATLKRQFIHAPLFRKRHNREFKMSAAINVGTLPSRLQALFLLGYIALNAAYCGMTINWTNKQTLYVDGVHRTGVVIAVNMCAIFLLAGRNNPLIWLLGITFDTYNLLHRWIGRIVVLETVAHVAFWVAGKYVQLGAEKAPAYIKAAITSVPLLLSGTIATAAFVFLLLHSFGAIRHAFYETFLHVHIIVAAVASGALWVHLNDLETQRVFLVAILFWVFERSARFYLLVRNNINQGLTTAEVEAMAGDAVRVTLKVARPWKFSPGQHVYLYIPSIGWLTSHPFSVVWSEENTTERDKILPTTNFDQFAKKKTTMSLVIRRRTGFTDALYRKAEVAQGGKLTATAFVEGPYGQQSFRSYGTVMLFAAGVGITHQVPHVRDLVQSFADGTCATRRIILVWVIQSPEHLEWIRPWMTQILGMEKRRDILKVLLFVSRPRSTKEIHSPSSSVQMFPGKPDVAALLQKEQDHQIGAMAVSVCGTGSMADDVRRAVRDRVQQTEMDFFEEAFSW